MNLIIFGASGSIGRLLVDQALAAGHFVTAFVRDPARLPTKHPQLRVVVGDVMKAESVAAALPGHDAVLCALGVLPNAKADSKRTQRNVPVCSTGTSHILAAMAKSGTRRLVVLTAANVGESRRTGRFGAAFIIWLVIGDIMEDKEKQEALIKASSTDWTIVRPVKLTTKPASHRVKSGEDLSWSLLSSVSLADTAEFMIAALSDTATIGRAITIRS